MSKKQLQTRLELSNEAKVCAEEMHLESHKVMGMGEYGGTPDEAGEAPTLQVHFCTYSYPSKHAIHSPVFSPLL